MTKNIIEFIRRSIRAIDNTSHHTNKRIYKMMKPCIITLVNAKDGDLPQEHNATIFNFDLDKIKLAVNAPCYTLPRGLTSDEFNAWMESKATKT